ncbi:TetR/AcrR family transcriptional regulator [Actinophytocola sp.]|uniref:TetR/AcrR family transcriptional regulator n=1 Tax=Actinophytocola sp. TaxID=1872138 RepID=UPI003D6B5AF3
MVGRTRKQRPSNTQYAIRRNEIVDQAAELFARNGYAATGIREIGDAAQLARGALYYYINSKEALLEEIHDRVMDPLLEEARKIKALECSPSARLRMISEVLLRAIIERRDHVWVFLHEYRSLTGQRRVNFKRKRAVFEKIVGDLLAEGVDEGEFEIDDPPMTSLAFLGMHHYTYQWVQRHPDMDPKIVSDIYCGIFFDGIRVGRDKKAGS